MNKIRQHIQEFGALPLFDRIQAFAALLIRAALVIAFLVALVERQWTVAFVSILAFAAVLLPLYLARTYRIRIPIAFEFVLTIFVFAALFLGEVHGFYTRLWWWDIVLHAGSGLALGFIGFLILFSFYRDGRFQARASLIAFLSFCVALSLGVLWEIFEFTMDTLFELSTQKSALDTMTDLIVDGIGAFLAAAAGFLYLRRKRRGFGIFQYYLHSYFLNKNE